MNITVTLTQAEAELIIEMSQGWIELDAYDAIADKIQTAWDKAYADIMPYDHFNE